MSYQDYDSNDVETAAYLAAEDGEPDYDRPTRAEAEADEAGADWVREPSEPEDTEEYTGRFCPVCGADIIGNDPHAPECPVETS